MAKGNMIVTLVANAKGFGKGLKTAGDSAKGFGKVVGGAMNIAMGAIGLLAGAIIGFLPNFIKMGEEARKSELRLGNVAKQMGLFGDNTEVVTKRISKYAEELSFLTGVDDELTRGNQAVLLTFSELAKSADEVGGPFDRATVALLDLEAAGKDLKAVALGRALQDPLKNMTALRKAGILLTDTQKDQIKVFMESNDILSAQDVLLDAIEGQVGGTAEATASATEKMNARFEDIVETLSLAFLPAVDTVATAMSEWLESDDGKKMVGELEQAFEDFATWVKSPEGGKTIEELGTTLYILATQTGQLAGQIGSVIREFKKLSDWYNAPAQKWLRDYYAALGYAFNPGALITDLFPRSPGPTPTPSAPGTPPRTGASGVTVNVSGITPTAAIGRTVQDALNTARRLGVR
jgi:hypothetical protein